MDEICFLISEKESALDFYKVEYMELKKEVEKLEEKIIDCDISDVTKFVHLYAEYMEKKKVLEDSLPDKIQGVEADIERLCDINIKLYNVFRKTEMER